MQILLFDMDGVLLLSRGYHYALQETVRRYAAGLPNRLAVDELPASAIAAFETAGITSEWDEAAACAVLLDIQQAAAERGYATLPLALQDFAALADALQQPARLTQPPLQRIEQLIFDELLPADLLDADAIQALRVKLRSARMPGSSTYRLFQELVLGSADYSRSYGVPSELNIHSYLALYDVACLSDSETADLLSWLGKPGRAAAILTARPSQPPEGVFGTPEAELGARAIGLQSLPIAGWGGMCWLGQRFNRDPQDFLKPNAVHALTALRLALGEPLSDALSAAAELYLTGCCDRNWSALHGAQVWVFEDTRSGMLSLLSAAQLLAQQGIELQTHLVGVAELALKAHALQSLGAQVFVDLKTALRFAEVIS